MGVLMYLDTWTVNRLLLNFPRRRRRRMCRCFVLEQVSRTFINKVWAMGCRSSRLP